MRRIDKNKVSPILMDLSRGTGGLGSGYFTMSGADNLPFDPTSTLLGTESDIPLSTELDTPIST